MGHSVDPSGVIAQVLQGYPPEFRPINLRPYSGTGGFSGAQIWRLNTPSSDLCLRRWPREHPSRERLQFIHSVLDHASHRGYQLAAVPIRRIDASTFVLVDGSLWELTRWLPGSPDFRPARLLEKLQAALQTLAEFHLATEGFPGAACISVSPTVLERQGFLAELIRGRAEQIACHIRASVWPELEQGARSIVRLFAGAAPSIALQLAEASRLETRLQPCIRDVHDEHVLFDGNRVTGLIDFGAMRIDSVAADIARLLGSMAVDDADAWSLGLAAYEAVRPLSERERSLVIAFDRSSVLMSGVNWLNWIYVQGRQFADTRAVSARIEEILERLEHLTKGS